MPEENGSMSSRAANCIDSTAEAEAVFAAACMLMAAPAPAHTVTPFNITLRPGGTDFVYVFDGFGCPADITITSQSPLVTITRVNMNNGNLVGGGSTSVTAPGRIDQLFQINAAATIATGFSTKLDVCWVGSDYPNPPCNENNCSPFAPFQVGVTVETLSHTTGSRPAGRRGCCTPSAARYPRPG